MGVSDVLPKILESSGRPFDLSEISSFLHKRRSRNRSASAAAAATDEDEDEENGPPLRIGIDVHSWIYTAGYAFSDRLADNRHLTNFGRANLLQEQLQQQQHPTIRTQDPSKEALQDYVENCTRYVMKRLQIVQSNTGAQLLVVLDGRSPPIKAQEVFKRRQLSSAHNKVRQDTTVILGSPSTVQAANTRRTTANKRAGPGRHVSLILESLTQALRDTSEQADAALAVSFMVAPYEADAQLAYLARQHYIDLIITEDSDLIAHGAPCILYKCLRQISETGTPAGVLWQRQDLGAMALGSHPPLLSGQRQQALSIKVTSGTAIQLLDFTPVMMAVLFVLLGCDYTGGETKKLKGIGLVSAHQIVRQAFLGNGGGRRDNDKSTQNDLEERPSSVLSMVLDMAYKQAYQQSILTPEYKQSYEKAFIEALFMYRHPVVFDPVSKQCIIVNRRFQGFQMGASTGDWLENYKNLGDPELLQHKEYARLCRNRLRIACIVGELPSVQDAVGIAEGEINWRTKEPTPPNALATALGVSVPVEEFIRRQQDRPDRRRVTEAGEESSESGRKRNSAPSTCSSGETGALSNNEKRSGRAMNLWSERDNKELERNVAAVGFEESDDEAFVSSDANLAHNFVGETNDSRESSEVGNKGNVQNPMSVAGGKEASFSDEIGGTEESEAHAPVEDCDDMTTGPSQDSISEDAHLTSNRKARPSPVLKIARRLFEFASPRGQSITSNPRPTENVEGETQQSEALHFAYADSSSTHEGTVSSGRKRRGKRDKSSNNFYSDASVLMSSDNPQRTNSASVSSGLKRPSQDSTNTRETPNSKRQKPSHFPETLSSERPRSPNLLASSTPEQSQSTSKRSTQTDTPSSPAEKESGSPEMPESSHD
ncbi:MAG: hypothetical protein SGILL_003463 [Bacillariaceae sp.]